MDFLDPVQLMILTAVGVLIFGKRLPEVARKVGAQLADVKRWVQHYQRARQLLEAISQEAWKQLQKPQE